MGSKSLNREVDQLYRDVALIARGKTGLLCFADRIDRLKADAFWDLICEFAAIFFSHFIPVTPSLSDHCVLSSLSVEHYFPLLFPPEPLKHTFLYQNT